MKTPGREPFPGLHYLSSQNTSPYLCREKLQRKDGMHLLEATLILYPFVRTNRKKYCG
jgi:hypothetical protein